MAAIELNEKEVLKALHRINTEILEERDKIPTLERIARSAMEVFGADACTIRRYEPTTKQFPSEASAGLGLEWKHTARGNGIGAKVIAGGDHIWVDNKEELNPAVQAVGMTCAGGFPLHPKPAEPVGVLYLHFRKNPHFAKDELNIVDLFSYHAGLAIRVAELRESDTKRIEDLNALRDASLNVVQGSTLRKQLERVANSAMNVMRADAAILYPWDEKDRTFRGDLVTGFGIDMKKFEFSKPRSGGLTETLMGEKVLWVEDAKRVSEEQEKLIAGIKKFVLDSFKLRAFIGIALVSDDEELGALYVCYREPHKPDDEELATLSILADLAATRIQLSKLSEARKVATEAQAISILSSGAAALGHRMTNVASTVPMVIRDIEKGLKSAGVDDQKIFERLGYLREYTVALVNMASELELEDVGEASPVDLCSVVQHAVRAAGVASIKGDVTVSAKLPKGLNSVSAVRPFLVDILINVLHNAAQAEAKCIRVEAVERSERGVVELIIWDDGKGMSQEVLSKIFTPFFSTKERRRTGKTRGTGLWTARHQINEMGGSISAKSIQGKGSTFTISLRTS